ncbi:Septation protein imp2 [Cladobotryum mycophilum]|uniref:Septation protein imp2 n=1 Tax=Cladobotryum mycophilum TaxID=491253 RepID=A0ABR0ST14_9HYPO
MPSVVADSPAVALSFANNFWGKDDAGVSPLIDRMVYAKQTCDELKTFYGARASIEEEYSKKLLNLAKKSLGSQETGTLKTSLDMVRAELEAMGKQHQNISAQMKTELEEPLAAFAGGMKERRKIVQNTVEKLLKTKVQQTQQVNKTRDKYEQECLKIKGYLAQGHMVMGQEERRNKAKLEKTQITLAASNTEYENAIKALEETTVRWNREWKAAADKFQDLEEERLDFTKSSLWTFANIASTVCVSDDSSCEKIRLSLEKMDVETDIISFITERGTGQEIPDAPKYINFCRGDVNDGNSDTSEDEHYSVAQFPRSINPAFRSSSPQPSTFESHHDPNSILANNLAHRAPVPASREANALPQKAHPQKAPQRSPQPARASTDDSYRRGPPAAQPSSPYDSIQQTSIPHDPYPRDGMSVVGRPGPPSDRSSQPPSARPSSRDSHSEYSNPTSFSSQEPPSGKTSPIKQDPEAAGSPEKRVLKKKSGFFQAHSPFRRKSLKDMQAPTQQGRNTWHPSNSQGSTSPVRRHQPYNSKGEIYSGGMDQGRHLLQERTASPEPIDVNASLALGVGHNVLPVTTPDTQRRAAQPPTQRVDENDPIAAALAELKGVTLGKNSSVRMSADNYHGISSPAPDAAMSRSFQGPGGHDMAAIQRGTPPPSYQSQTQITRLGVPPPAVTSKAMKEATKKAASQTRSVYGDGFRRDSVSSATSPMSRPGTRGNDMSQPPSPGPARSVSPQPHQRRMSNDPRRMDRGSVSPNPYNNYQQRNSSQVSLSQPRGSDQSYYRQASPHGSTHGSTRGSTRGVSPSPYRDYNNNRPQSSYGGSDMAVQLAAGGDDRYGSSRSRTGRSESRAMGLYDGGHQRSKSVADPTRYSRDGKPIMHMARALYMYQAAIPEELGFAKGDILTVYRHQDDGWWEAEVQNGNGRIGLVPSNYLQAFTA